MNRTISASCSIAPLSLKSDIIGLWSLLASTALDSCESAIIGIFNSFANDFKDLDMYDISCCHFQLFLLCAIIADNQQL